MYNNDQVLEFSVNEFRTVRNVLNFAIKAKDECLDSFVLFDRTASKFFLALASEYVRVSMLGDSKEHVQMRSLRLSISYDDPLFIDKVTRLKQLIFEFEPIRRIISISSQEGELDELILAYFSPFLLTSEAASHLRKQIEQMLD